MWSGSRYDLHAILHQRRTSLILPCPRARYSQHTLRLGKRSSKRAIVAAVVERCRRVAPRLAGPDHAGPTRSATASTAMLGGAANWRGRQTGVTRPRSERIRMREMAMTEKKKDDRGFRRGLTNYGDRDFSLYLRRSFASSMGDSRQMLDRPIVGIASSASGFNNCHRHFPELIEAVKRGVLAAGALPIEFPTISLGETFLHPTSLKFRNLMSMDVEEMVRAQPMDAVVLVGGCDKTVPAQLMGAASADIPAIQLVGGPMSTSRHRGERLGACTDCRRFWARYRAGAVGEKEISEIEQRLATTAGSCAVMGTASTMASLAEALGMMPSGAAAIPAVDADRLRIAEETGGIAVSLIGSNLCPSRVITQKAIENATRVLLAIGGS